jgi:hypothetical protein
MRGVKDLYVIAQISDHLLTRRVACCVHAFVLQAMKKLLVGALSQ